MGGPKRLGFFLRPENDLASGGIEINLVFAWGVEFTLFFYADRKLHGYSVWIEIDLVLVWGSKLTWFLCAGPR